MFKSKSSKSKWWVALAVLALSVMAGPAEAQPYVYVLGASYNYPNDRNHYLRVYNAATNTIVTGITLGETQFSDQKAIAMAPDGALIYVINNYNRSDRGSYGVGRVDADQHRRGYLD